MEILSKKEFINKKDDFGLNDYLTNAIASATELIKLNEDLIIENTKLKHTILGLKQDIDTLKVLNKDLYVLLDKAKTDKEEPIVIIGYDEALEYSEEYGTKYLNKINWKDIKTVRWRKLLKIAYKYKYLSQVLSILSFLLINKSSENMDNELSEILVSTQYLLDNSIDFDTHSIIKYLNILYSFIDEDLLIEFTCDYKDYFDEHLTQGFNDYKRLKIKIARILYAVEEYGLADSLIADINFEMYKEQFYENEIKVEVLLMLIHLTKYKSLDDFGEFGKLTEDRSYSEINSIHSYLNAIESPTLISETIDELETCLKSYDLQNNEVSYGIRYNSFKFMINELSKMKSNEDCTNSTESVVSNSFNKRVPELNKREYKNIATKVEPKDKQEKNSSNSDGKILCHSCMEREECLNTYLEKTECENFKAGPTRQPRNWPKEMSGPYGTYGRYR